VAHRVHDFVGFRLSPQANSAEESACMNQQDVLTTRNALCPMSLTVSEVVLSGATEKNTRYS